jgi:hypothetical protein
MSNRLGGKQGTSYQGNNANQPPNWSFNTRPPNDYDTQNVSIGDLWFDESATGVNRVWMLVSLAGNSTSRGPLAQWVQFGTGELSTLTGNDSVAVSGDANRNINIVGTGNILVTGNAPSHTLSVSLNQSAFGAKISASIPNATGAGAILTIPFNSTFFNIGNNFDTGTGLYTAPETGTYSFSATVTMSTLTSLMTTGYMSFQVTGTGPSTDSWGSARGNPWLTKDAGAGYWRNSGSLVAQLNAGDTVGVVVRIESGMADTATVQQGTAAAITWFTGVRIY